MKSSNKIYLSIVCTARNDDYGKNLINRFYTTVRVLIHATNYLKINCEYILVDYNAVPKIPYLIQSCNFPPHPYLKLKTYIVNNSFHRKISNTSKVPLYEYIGKNIGIRRANGKYILSTNPDIILTPLFLKSIYHKLKPDYYYRASRHDLTLNHFPEKLSIHTILTLCHQHTLKILGNGKIIYPSKIHWLLETSKIFIKDPTILKDSIKGYVDRFKHFKDIRYIPFLNNFSKKIHMDIDKIHDVAAGDFLLMHRDIWHLMRGYDETKTNSFLDSYLLYVMYYCYKIKQKELNTPIYHIAHEYARKGRPMTNINEYYQNIKKMKENHHPYHTNSINWGYANIMFKEIYL